ncbi:YagK/YfjJ domain-containing protein [Vibrio marisflavi]|uniref:YagK/YfjJ C-terminal domain-containing protein n=1 Tax=Vibrio marisflavi CECT 7928 TaxID=634439 RepID=A0ABM9A9U7_9VIBR|nr:inovirus-type Gp2 protein [Vibrio marisflavi]CAH0541815.1 hypothetical protein VMF7928_03860 [Vibrio marisflavi CECT 7928]
MFTSSVTLHPTRRNVAYYHYKGEEQPILYSEKGVCTKILKATFEQIDKLFSYYSKVTIVLTQLHQSQYSNDNAALSKYFKIMTRKLKKHFATKYMAYIWAREQSTPDTQQHYHIAFILNGHKCNKSYTVDGFSEEVWKQVSEGGFVYKPKNRVFLLYRSGKDALLRSARMRLSYAAKHQSKDQIQAGIKRFGVSQLRYKQS